MTLTGVGHFAPREDPVAVARHLIDLFTGDPANLSDRTDRSLVAKKVAPIVAAIAAIGIAAVAATGIARTRGRRSQLTLVAQFDHQVTGVAIAADGRRFVNFPRWTDDAPISVAQVLGDG